MPIIYQKSNQVVAHNPDDPTWKAWSVSDEYYGRLMAGEHPASWDQLLLPNLDRFLDLAVESPEWTHISTHAEIPASQLMSALLARSTVKKTTLMRVIRGLMTAVNATLEAKGQSLSDQLVDSVDEKGDPIQITMSEQVDEWLADCYFGFTMADIGG